jgi:hypothetical protein
MGGMPMFKGEEGQGLVEYGLSMPALLVAILIIIKAVLAYLGI